MYFISIFILHLTSQFFLFQELVHQGEQLDNVEKKTDKINQDMKTSQRHLNGIKSIFGGIKNWWNGDDKKKEEEPKPEQKRDTKLLRAMNDAPERRIDTRGFGEDTDFGRPAAATQGAYGGHKEQLRSGFKDHDDQLDRNLGKKALITIDEILFSI